MMVLKESQLWQLFKVQLANYQLASTWARRYETRLQAGIPDVECRVGNITGHIELKVSLVKTATTRLRPGLRADQRNWLEEFRGPAVTSGEDRRRAPAGVLISVPSIHSCLIYVPANRDNTNWWSEEYSFNDWFEFSHHLSGPDAPVLWSCSNHLGWKSFFHAWSKQ